MRHGHGVEDDQRAADWVEVGVRVRVRVRVRVGVRVGVGVGVEKRLGLRARLEEVAHR